MAKLIAPAQIVKVTELLELLPDPPKYAQYLLNLKQLQDNINEKLGVIETKELRDRMGASAEEKVSEANICFMEEKEEADKIIEEATTEREKSKSLLSDAMESAERIRAEIEALQKSVRQREINNEDERKALEEQSQAISIREASVKKREDAIDARQSNFSSPD